jgi:broad specificity phosphatase PhoE
MLIKLVRHAEAEHNIGDINPQIFGDYEIELTDLGREQAKEVGKIIAPDFIKKSLIYCSPYKRAGETLDGILTEADVDKSSLRIYEDPRLRELDHGYGNVESQQQHRKVHGWFYYRYEGGESPADCYDRTSMFLESMMRQVSRKRCKSVLIVTHGLSIRCFVMRFLHLTVEQFDEIINPANCDIITIGRINMIQKPQFKSHSWAVSGLKRYNGS